MNQEIQKRLDRISDKRCSLKSTRGLDTGFFPLFKRSMSSVEEEIEEFSRALWKRKGKERYKEWLDRRERKRQVNYSVTIF